MASAKSPYSPVVLVVEDEPILRLNTGVELEEAGFHVIEAHHADEAIELLKKRTDIRILFTDIDMPGSMDGLKLAAAVRNRWPPIEIIVTSGKVSPSRKELPERSLFLPKPYMPDRLVRTIKSLLH